jgi:polysaccharide export outer membrane protein
MTMSELRTKICRRTSAGLALLAAAALGCASTSNPVPAPTGASYGSYRVGAPDILEVSILPEPTIERQVVVRPDGMISMDLIGDVPAGGRTVEEIASDIEKRIARFKRDASVTVRLKDAESTAITVFGEVRGPDAFPLVKETRVAEAIGMVGGETIFARTGRIRVIRSGGGEAAVYIVDLNAIRAGDMRTNIVLASGDIVYVPPNVFARIGYAMNLIFLPFQPFLGMANAFLGAAVAP